MSNSEEPSTSTPPSNSSHTSTMHSQGVSDVTQPSRVPMSDDIKEQSQIEALKFEKSPATDSHVDDGSASQIAQTQKISPGKISIRPRKISPSPQRPFMQQKKGSKMPPSQQNNESLTYNQYGEIVKPQDILKPRDPESLTVTQKPEIN